MTDYRDPNDFEFEKDVDIDVEVELEFDTEVDFDKNFDLDLCIDAKADVDGNIATLTFDVEAIGKDTLAEADVVVLAVENELSMVSGSMVAAVDDGHW